jgi:hypothetical protein
MRELLSRSTSSEETSASDHLGVPGKQSLTELVQRHARGTGMSAGASAYVQRASESAGSALPADLSSRLGGALGTDVSSVRVHTGGESAQAAASLSANAYTVGQDVHFGAGMYQPGTPGGDRLIAHEVAHTVQQRGATASVQEDMQVSTPGDAHEQEAETFAQSFVEGGGAPVTPVSQGVVSRSVIQRDPRPQATPDAPATADPASVDKSLAQQKLLDYRDTAGAFITGNHHWLTQNWTHYLSRTSQNPMLGWADGTAASVVSNALGNLLTELGQNLIKKGSAMAAGALVGSAVAPGVGTVIGFVIGVLVESAASMIFEAISGKSDTAAAANAASRRTGALIEAQYGDLARANDAANAELNTGYRATQTALTSASDQATVDRIGAWADAEKAKAERPAPISDRSLALRMIQEWVLEHAGDEEDANRNTDETEWEAARTDAFGEGDLDGHREIFAYQTRHEWSTAGLDVSQAQAIIDDVMAMRRGPDGITQSISTATAYQRYNGRRYTLPVTDAARWGAYWREYKRRPTSIPHRRGWEAAAALIDAGQFTLDCTLDLTTADMSCYVDHWDYEIVLTAEPPIYWRTRNPFSVSPD